MYIFYEINLWPFNNVGRDFVLGNSLFRAVKLIRNPDPSKYKYSDYGIGFDASGSFSLSNGCGFRKNVIMFGADMSSSVHVDNMKKYTLILVNGPAQGLDDTELTAEAEYSINFSE